MNSNDWYVKTRGVGGYNGGDIDPECIELINDLIDATGAKIIMSSSWRSDYENSCEYLYDNGLYCDAIIGKTPHFCYTCQNDGGRPVILVDMDATLCLNTSGRPFYGENSANGMLEDTPVEEICRLVRQMGEHCLVFIVTGREGTAEVVDATKEWLKKNEIPSDAMFFRPVGDYSPGPDCKRRIYEENIKGKYNVQFVLDDSSKCVKMWREQGLICLQPNEGKF